jgi:hypothetical protein
MAKFQVLRRVDAFADYVAEVEADTPEQAAQLAYDDETKFDWGFPDVTTFDDRCFATLDEDDSPLEDTAQGNEGLLF